MKRNVIIIFLVATLVIVIAGAILLGVLDLIARLPELERQRFTPLAIILIAMGAIGTGVLFVLAAASQVFGITIKDLLPKQKQPSLQVPATAPVAQSQSVQAPQRKKISGEFRHGLRDIHLIGREAELEQIRQLLKDHRVTTIVGFGGVGKTRLAAEAAFTADFRDGVIWHRIPKTADTSGLIILIREHLQLVEQDSPNAVLAALHDKAVLLVLDNAEDAPNPAAYIALIEQIDVRGGTRILVTSRYEWPTLPGKSVYRLDAPQADKAAAILREMAKYEGVEQHLNGKAQPLAQAARYHPGLLRFSVIWLKNGHPTDHVLNLLTTLEGSDAQEALDEFVHKTIQQMATGSGGANAKHALQRLAICASSFSVEAAKAIMDADPAALGLLKQWGLLQIEAERYSIHPLVRAAIETDYAAFDAYAEHYIAVAAQFDELPREQWRAIEDADLPNIIAVGDALVEQYKPYMTDISPPLGTPVGTAFLPSEPPPTDLTDRALRFALNIQRYLFYRRELRRMEWLAMGLAAARAAGDRKCEGLFLNEIGNAYSDYGDKHSAIRYLEQSLVIVRELGAQQNEATTLNNIGGAWHALGEPRKALDYYAQALPLIRAVGDRSGEAVTLNNIGLAWADLGEVRKALDYYEQALPMHRAVGNRTMEATTLNNIGLVYRQLGEPRKALDYFAQALPLFRAVGDRSGEATTLTNIGLAWADLGEKRVALDYYEQALPLRRAVGDRGGEAKTLNNMAAIYFHEKDYARAADTFRQIIPIVAQIGDVQGEALFTYNLAYVLGTALGETAEAIALVERAIALLESKGLHRDAGGTTVAQMRAFLAELRGE